MPVNPTPNVPGNGGSPEKSLNEILDLLTAFYQMVTGGGTGIPVNTSGLPVSLAVENTVPGGPTDCTGAAQSVTVGNIAKHNAFSLVSVMFDTGNPRDVTISVVVNGNERTWVKLVAYTGPYILLDDKVEGDNYQIKIDVGQHAGSFTHLVTLKET